MDGRDPSAAAGDGPVEDDGTLSVPVALANEAASLFQSRRYSECLDVLGQLARLKEDDPKVIHNIAIAEYFRDGCSDPRTLLGVLNKVKKWNKELAHSSREEVEDSTSPGNNIFSGSGVYTNILYQLSAANSGHITYADEFDTSIVTLNIAVVLFHLHEYEYALSVLEPLYQNIEPVDEVTTLHICVLLLDIALATQDAPRAADVIQYLEKFFGVGYMINLADNGTNTQNQSSIQGAPTKINVALQEAAISDSIINTNIPESSLARTSSNEQLEDENLFSEMDGGAPTFGRPASNDVSKSSVDQTSPAVDLKLNMQLYKVRFLLLTRNLKSAKREVKLAMNIARSRDSSTALLLKSQLEYARGNHRKAIKLLMTSCNRTEPGMLSMFHNNLGCIYHQLGKHHMATLFFTKALRSCSVLRSEKPLNLSTYSQDKSPVIFYNSGLQYLACGKPLTAARCFYRATSSFRNQPLFWLRLAECCLLAQEKGLLRRAVSASVSEEVKLLVISSGKWRHLVIDDVNSRSRHLDSTGVDGQFGPDGESRLSLPFACQCLLNALHLLDNLDQTMSKLSTSFSVSEGDNPNQATSIGTHNSRHKNVLDGDSKALNLLSAASGDSKETKGSISSNVIFQSSLSYEDICRKENHMIRQAVLGDLAYLELGLENPLKALFFADALQHLPDCSKMYLFLSDVYAAEALCLLNRPSEATERLSTYITNQTVLNLPYTDEDTDRWGIETVWEGEGPNYSTTIKRTGADIFMTPEEARGTLYLNLACTSAMEGNLETANWLVTEALSRLPNNPKAVLAAVYVDLRRGKTQDALLKLKQAADMRFIYPSGSTTLINSNS